MNELVVIFNSNAGGKVHGPAGGTSEDQLRDVLSRHGLDARVIPTDSEESAKRAVAEAVQAGAETIIAAGGDGTVGLVATELLGNTNVTLGILPMGSVMNIARMLGISRDLDGAAAVIAAGKTRVIDAGEANGVTFYEAASVGMHAGMFSTAQHFEDGDWGSPLKALWQGFRYRPAHMFIEMD